METIEEWIKELKEADKLVLVEGKSDKDALAVQGITKLYTISQKPLFKTVEDIACTTREVVILTDLDKEGRKYYSYLKNHLQRHGVQVDKKFREFLLKNTNIKQIESMKKLI